MAVRLRVQTEVRSLESGRSRAAFSPVANQPLSPNLCIHVVAVLLVIIVYRDHAMEQVRPQWLKLRGTRFFSDSVLILAGIRRNWLSYLNVMTSVADVVPKKILREKPVPKKRGPKPKQSKPK